MTGEEKFPFSDLTLARRLEKKEGRSNAEFVEARAKLFPESGAEWIEVAGAYVMYDGVGSPLTQTFGLGLVQPVTRDEMERIEEFYAKHGAEVFHEVSPLADPSLLVLLNERGYRPMEFTSVLYRPVRSGLQLAASRNEKIQVRLIRDGEQELWARTAARGWSEFTELADFMLEIAQVSAGKATALPFIAELDGQAIATGALSISDGVALLAGASTVPEGRKQGAQLALLETRLRYAAEHGCDIAMIDTQPGSASQRNAERHGFRIAYTRIKWQLRQRAEV
jgi:GNAT superfamily N-acetyltransferase